jgi:ribosomal protein S18 acetylase RimI-like enzyme
MAPPTQAELAAIERQLDELFRPRGARWPSRILREGLSQGAASARQLAHAGWAQITSEEVLFTRHPPEVPHLEPDLRIEAVTRATATECVELETDVFGLFRDDQAERAQRLAAAIEAGRLRAYLVRHRGVAVASARLLVADAADPGRVAGLHGIGVVEHQRRRGYGRLVTAVASRAGLASGSRLVWLSVEPGNEPALALYRSLGFVPAFAWTRWVASSAG